MPGVDDIEKKEEGDPANKPGADSGEQGDKKQEGENKSEGDKKSDDKGASDKVDLSTLDPRVQKLIKDLRTENGSYRNKSKDLETKYGTLKKGLVDAGIIEDDSEAPEEKIKSLTATTSALELSNAILSAAVEHEVPKGAVDYFQFLVSKSMDELEEGGELSEDAIAELASQARKTVIGAKSTSVGSGDGDDKKGAKTPPAPGGSSEITLDQFVAMNIVEKSALYEKNKDLYNRLWAEAKGKNLIRL